MNIHGELEERDTLRLLAVLRYVRRGALKQETLEHLVVAEPEIGGVKVQITLGRFIDDVLHEYREYET